MGVKISFMGCWIGKQVPPFHPNCHSKPSNC
jgi:hypothetical protein